MLGLFENHETMDFTRWEMIGNLLVLVVVVSLLYPQLVQPTPGANVD
jgi:hypothetical protein